MENSDIKMIREKLTSLDTFPAGYEPNLDSKWSLLEASIGGESKTSIGGYIWLKAAAVLLLCSFLIPLFLKEGPSKVVVKAKPVVLNKKPIPDQPAKLVVEKQITRRPQNTSGKRLSGSQFQEATLNHTVVSVHTDERQIFDSIEAVPAANQEIASETALHKKKKVRYVQMDFGDADQESKTSPVFYTLHPRFIMFGSGNKVKEENVQTNSHSALLRINF